MEVPSSHDLAALQKRESSGRPCSPLVNVFCEFLETGDMDSAYGIVIGAILLFPWSIVALMLARMFWSRVRAFVDLRHRNP